MDSISHHNYDAAHMGEPVHMWAIIRGMCSMFSGVFTMCVTIYVCYHVILHYSSGCNIVLRLVIERQLTLALPTPVKGREENYTVHVI